jgi:S1-C subfamily serine protease
VCCAATLNAFSADQAPGADARGVDAERFFSAIVKVQARALPDARSAATLGTAREGSGVVIDETGLVVTIGYLIIEADEVSITDDHGRSLPASVVGYDHATGLALVRAIAPLAASPLPLGDSTKLEETDPVLGPAETGRDRRRDVAWYGDPVAGTQFA